MEKPEFNTNQRHAFSSVMLLDSLELIQDGIRSLDNIKSMMRYIKRGGVFKPEVVYDTIAITEFPDGRRVIHDGLHRCLSVYLCGKRYLLPCEYHIKYWDYDHYNQCSPESIENGYFTPFDPRFECRLADFGEFKQQVKDMIEMGCGLYEIADFIMDTSYLYRTKKTLYNLNDLAEVVRPLLNTGLNRTKRKIRSIERLTV